MSDETIAVKVITWDYRVYHRESDLEEVHKEYRNGSLQFDVDGGYIFNFSKDPEYPFTKQQLLIEKINNECITSI